MLVAETLQYLPRHLSVTSSWLQRMRFTFLIIYVHLGADLHLRTWGTCSWSQCTLDVEPCSKPDTRLATVQVLSRRPKPTSMSKWGFLNIDAWCWDLVLWCSGDGSRGVELLPVLFHWSATKRVGLQCSAGVHWTVSLSCIYTPDIRLNLGTKQKRHRFSIPPFGAYFRCWILIWFVFE